MYLREVRQRKYCNVVYDPSRYYMGLKQYAGGQQYENCPTAPSLFGRISLRFSAKHTWSVSQCITPSRECFIGAISFAAELYDKICQQVASMCAPDSTQTFNSTYMKCTSGKV
jgi:hypothetical protein